MTPREQQIVDRVKLMLGGDVLKIEIPDQTIQKCIEIAMETITPYIPDTRYYTTKFSRCIDMSTRDCEEVLRVIPGSQLSSMYGIGDEFNFGFNTNVIGNQALSTWSTTDSYKLRSIYVTSSMSVLPDQNISFDYDRTTKKLYLTPGITSEGVTIEYIPTVYKVDDLQEQASFKWVYLYTLALSKEIIGRIRSKAKSQNVPIQLDGDTLLAEAQQEKLKLEDALISESYGPVGILR